MCYNYHNSDDACDSLTTVCPQSLSYNAKMFLSRIFLNKEQTLLHYYYTFILDCSLKFDGLNLYQVVIEFC